MFKKRTLSAQSVRESIIVLAGIAGQNGSHIGSSLSCVELLCSVYENFDIIGDKNPDVFILSKGHAALCQFAVLHQLGILSDNDVKSFNQNGTEYFCHSKKNEEKFLNFSGGSLGLGLSYGLGLALHFRATKQKQNVVIVVGDGELDEGICWEALTMIAHLGLKNMLILVDKNQMQSDGHKAKILNQKNLAQRLIAMGLLPFECSGHSLEELRFGIQKFHEGEANIILADTIKGKGIDFMEHNPDWHYGVLSEKIMRKIQRDHDAVT